MCVVIIVWVGEGVGNRYAAPVANADNSKLEKIEPKVSGFCVIPI